jgi:hypothetical protein
VTTTKTRTCLSQAPTKGGACAALPAALLPVDATHVAAVPSTPAAVLRKDSPARPRICGGSPALHSTCANTAGLHHTEPAAHLGLGCNGNPGNGARWPTRSSTAAITGCIRGHRAPVTTNNRRLHRDTHHRCTRMCKRSNLPPVSRSSRPASSKLQLRTLQARLRHPRPCGVICLLQPAWIK